MERQAADWEKVFARHHLTKDCHLEFMSGSQELMVKQYNYGMDKRHGEGYTGVRDARERVFASRVNKGMQVRPAVRCYRTPFKPAKLKKVDNVHCCQRSSGAGSLQVTSGNIIYLLWKTIW
jgi:hypothetical protein